MNDPELYDSVADRQGDMSEALAQALQEKVVYFKTMYLVMDLLIFLFIVFPCLYNL